MKNQLSRLATLLILAAAGLGIGTAAQAQPGHPPSHARPAHVKPHHPAKKKHKVWVPAHREHGRLVKGHYVRR